MPLHSRRIPVIALQHQEDAASLRAVRSVLIRAPHVKLLQLGRADERLLAHLDGLSVAGEEGYAMARSALEVPGVGQLFVAAALAVERRDTAQIERLLALVGAVPDAPRALASATGWMSSASLRGITASFLTSQDPTHRWLGITSCALHRVDPGAALTEAIDHSDARLRVAALRCAGHVGRMDLLPLALKHASDGDATCKRAAAMAAVLLGDRNAGASALESLALLKAAPDRPALQLALLAADPPTARRLVRQLADQGTPQHTTIQAAGWAGDARAIPWLIDHMADDRHARAAGEAFSLITGADLAALDLERKPPEQVEGGPTEDPEDDNVALDEDESLPWPDQARVQAWWKARGAGIPQGVRVLAGAVADPAQCAQVLAHATQRQRQVAALLLCLARPGSVLFNVAAPAHRQRRLLGAALP